MYMKYKNRTKPPPVQSTISQNEMREHAKIIIFYITAAVKYLKNFKNILSELCIPLGFSFGRKATELAFIQHAVVQVVPLT